MVHTEVGIGVAGGKGATEVCVPCHSGSREKGRGGRGYGIPNSARCHNDVPISPMGYPWCAHDGIRDLLDLDLDLDFDSIFTLLAFVVSGFSRPP